MNKSTPVAAAQPQHAHHLLEGGLFYPSGYIVAGLPNHEDALRIQCVFSAAGYREDECLLVRAQEMAEIAAEDVDKQWFIAALGSSAHVRERQMKLAQEGCHFLMIKAPTDAEKLRVLKVLTQVPVRYAVHYHRFVIEDLIQLMPSATADHESARI